MVSSLPCALSCVWICNHVPHVHAEFPFSFCHRIVSSSAPLPLTGAPKIFLHPPCGGVWSPRPTQRLPHLSVGADDSVRPNDRRKDAFSAPHQRQRRKTQVHTSSETKSNVSRERAAGTHHSAQTIARPEAKEPEVPSGAFAYFCRRCVKKICRWHIFSIRSRQLCCRSIHCVYTV